MAQDEDLRVFFQSVDTDNSGSINETELQEALASGNLRFNRSVIAQMIKMYDREQTGSMSYQEFVSLHKFLSVSLDKDASFSLPIVFSVEVTYPLPRIMRGWSSSTAVAALGCTPDDYASWYNGVDTFHAGQLLRPMPPDIDALLLVFWTPPSRNGAKRART
ncbi:hypothetical protein L7F22_026049 [Adiantum nelumboides]|nr:hypothetical protein [Adiantum nelumboides]